MNIAQQLGATDLDWFAVDRDGFIAHFATGVFGGVPSSIISSERDLQTVVQFFRNEATKKGTGVLSKDWAIHAGVNPDKKQAAAMYADDFINMASNGLYSYEAYASGPRPSPYFLVAYPESPLRVTELPKNIADIVNKTSLDQSSFARTLEVKADMFISKT